MDRVLKMPFSQVYSLLVAKAERKGRTRQEVNRLTLWLTGYSPEELEQVKQMVKEIMEDAAHLAVRLAADVQSGENWYDCHS